MSFQCARAFKYNRTGVFLVDATDGSKGEFSESNWGLSTAGGMWAAEIYEDICSLDDNDWSTLLTVALTTFKKNARRDPVQEQSARAAAMSEAAAVETSLATPAAPQARRPLLKNKKSNVRDRFHIDQPLTNCCPLV